MLSQRLTSREYTETLLETALATAQLSPADRGLCHELVCGIVRWQITLDRLIARKTDPARELRPALRNFLRLGLYQIFWLDRIPPHAITRRPASSMPCSAPICARRTRSKKFSPT